MAVRSAFRTKIGLRRNLAAFAFWVILASIALSGSHQAGAMDLSSDADAVQAEPVRHFLAKGDGNELDMVRVNSSQLNVFDITTAGTNPSLILNGTQYFYVWETQGVNNRIEYAVLSHNGHFVKPVTQLNVNTPEGLFLDTVPASAAAPNGRVGVVWLRQEFGGLGTNYHVNFAILNAAGEVLVGPFSVTTGKEYESPTVLATSENLFVISWVEKTDLPDDKTNTNIQFAVYNSNGVFDVADEFRGGQEGQILYSQPRLLELDGQRLLVTYSVRFPDTIESIPHFSVYSTETWSFVDSDIVGVELTGAKGLNPDSVLLANSKVLVAWVNNEEGDVEYAILDDTDIASDTFNIANLKSLQNPDGRSSDASSSVSLAATSDGEGIFSWRDGVDSKRLYYALVNSTGTVVTPPLILFEDMQSSIAISRNGQGIAPPPEWNIYMPVISKP